MILDEAAEEGGVFAGGFHLVDSVGEVGDAASRTLEGSSNGVVGGVV